MCILHVLGVSQSGHFSLDPSYSYRRKQVEILFVCHCFNIFNLNQIHQYCHIHQNHHDCHNHQNHQILDG